jgi:hypothetical protein
MNVSRPRKLRETATFRDRMICVGTGAIEFQDRCLKPLGHRSRDHIRYVAGFQLSKPSSRTKFLKAAIGWQGSGDQSRTVVEMFHHDRRACKICALTRAKRSPAGRLGRSGRGRGVLLFFGASLRKATALNI